MFCTWSTHRFGGRHLTNLCLESSADWSDCTTWPRRARMRLVPVLTPPLGKAAGMATTEARRECETEDCSKDAKLQCPTCIKLGIQGSYFCSQVPLLCFDFSRCKRQQLSCTGPFSLKRLLTVKLEMCALLMEAPAWQTLSKLSCLCCNCML